MNLDDQYLVIGQTLCEAEAAVKWLAERPADELPSVDHLTRLHIYRHLNAIHQILAASVYRKASYSSN